MKSEDNNLGNLFSAKLKFYMDKAKIKSPELGRRLGVTSATVRHWYNGARFPNDILKISEIADVLNISMIDLLPYSAEEKQKIVKDELLNNINDYQSLLPANILPSFVKTVALINSYVGAGSFGVSEDLEVIDTIYVDIHTIDKSYRDKELQAVRVAGDSMIPYVNDGDIALFCKFKEGEAATGDGKYIIGTSQGEQIKNIKFMLNGNIRIISENSSYHTKDGYDEEIDKNSQEYLNIIGKVVGRILKG